MKNLLHSFRTSRIVRKLTTRVLVIEAFSFIIILVLSFLFLWPQLNQQAIVVAEDICTQMENKIESSMISLQSSSQYIISSRELKVALKSYFSTPSKETFEMARLVLNELQVIRTDIRGIILEGPDFTLFDSTASLYDLDYSILSQDWHQLAKISDYGSGYSYLYEPFENAGYSYAYSKSYLIGTSKFVLTLYFDASDMLNNVDALGDNVFSSYTLADHNGYAFYSSGAPEMQEDEWREMLTSHQGMSISRNGDYFVSPIPTSMWSLIAKVDSWSLNRVFLRYFSITIILFALLCIFTFFLLIPMIHRTIQPIGKLAGTMSLVKEGRLDTVISRIKTGDEIEALSDVFNDMIRSLQEHIEERVKHEQREQKMKFSLLASQIDPHFICNTMNIINFLARDNRSNDIIEINTALISLLQDRLRVDSLRVFDTIMQEVRAVKAYLTIQGFRYENNAKITWKIETEVLDLPIPKNVIQPLVENAMFHGLIDEETGEIRGNIVIEIRKENDVILIRVEDDGKGIDTERLRQLNTGNACQEEERGRHIGLQNIRERLTYLYHSKDCMKIESSGGTSVIMKIPLQ